MKNNNGVLYLVVYDGLAMIKISASTQPPAHSSFSRIGVENSENRNGKAKVDIKTRRLLLIIVLGKEKKNQFGQNRLNLLPIKYLVPSRSRQKNQHQINTSLLHFFRVSFTPSFPNVIILKRLSYTAVSTHLLREILRM